MGDLLLVRHGETEWSRSGQHTSFTDLPLTEHGEEQAASLAPLLAGRSFALVLTSPLGRAVRSRELEVEVSRVPGVDELRGLRLFRQAGTEWQPLPAIAVDGAQILSLQPWQLPELLSVVAIEGDAAPTDLRALPNPFAEADAVAVPVVPELC